MVYLLLERERMDSEPMSVAVKLNARMKRSSDIVALLGITIYRQPSLAGRAGMMT